MKKIILILSGSVASIRYLDLVESIGVKHELKIIFTKGSEPFINKYELTQHKLIKKVYSDDITIEELENISHIQLAKETDVLLIAPASFNYINSYAQGIANTFSLTLLSAMDKNKVLIAPAMNTRMYNNEILQNNLLQLQKFGCKVIEPIVGELSCKEIGIGKMEDISKIANKVEELLGTKPKKTAIITCGSTKMYIDPIRYITNESSGKFGINFANELYKRNYNVHLIHGEAVNLEDVYFGIKKYKIKTNEEMIKQINQLKESSDLIIMATAPVDYIMDKFEHKIKDKVLELKLNKSEDIIKGIKNIKKVGFALESENHETYAHEKLIQKNLDYILINDIKTMGNEYVYNAILMSKKEKIKYEKILKRDIVKKIVDIVDKDLDV